MQGNKHERTVGDVPFKVRRLVVTKRARKAERVNLRVNLRAGKLTVQKMYWRRYYRRVLKGCVRKRVEEVGDSGGGRG